jgi:hypothetical protein
MTAVSHIRHVVRDVVTCAAVPDPGVRIIASGPEGNPSPRPYRILNDTIPSPTSKGSAMSALSNRVITEPEAADFVMTARVGYRGDALWTEPNFMELALCTFFGTIGSRTTKLDRPGRMCHGSRAFTRRGRWLK